MPLDILTIGEALVEVMRTDIDPPLLLPAPFAQQVAMCYSFNSTVS